MNQYIINFLKNIEKIQELNSLNSIEADNRIVELINDCKNIIGNIINETNSSDIFIEIVNNYIRRIKKKSNAGETDNNFNTLIILMLEDVLDLIQHPTNNSEMLNDLMVSLMYLKINIKRRRYNNYNEEN